MTVFWSVCKQIHVTKDLNCAIPLIIEISMSEEHRNEPSFFSLLWNVKPQTQRSFLSRTYVHSLIQIQWNLVITRSLGPWKLPLYQVSHYIRVKKKKNIKSRDQQNDLVIRGFCYIWPLYNEVPLYRNYNLSLQFQICFCGKTLYELLMIKSTRPTLCEHAARLLLVVTIIDDNTPCECGYWLSTGYLSGEAMLKHLHQIPNNLYFSKLQ